MPFEFIKKTMMTGIGMALKTQAEFEEMTQAFIKKSRMSEDEGRKFIEEMLEKYQEAKGDMEKKIETSVKNILQNADIASNKGLTTLKEEIETLKVEIETLKEKLK